MNHFNSGARAVFIAAGALVATSLLHAQVPEEQAPVPEEQAPADVAAAPPAPEQQAPADVTAPTPAPGATTPIADAKVEQFAAAFVDVQDIQSQTSQQLSAAKDDQQASQLKADAEKKMIEAVERQGLQIQEFNRIAQLMTTDLQLRSKVVEKVQQRRKG